MMRSLTAYDPGAGFSANSVSSKEWTYDSLDEKRIYRIALSGSGRNGIRRTAD